MAKKQHLDDFLREKLDQLPNASVAGFEKVETRMEVQSRRGILVLLLLPLLFSGLYWLFSLSEGDLILPQKGKDIPMEQTITSDEVIEKTPVPQSAVTNDAEQTIAAEENNFESSHKDLQAQHTKATAPPIIAVVNADESIPPTASHAATNDELVEMYVNQEIEAEIPLIYTAESNSSDVTMNTSLNPQEAQVYESAAMSVVTEYTQDPSPWSATLNVYPNYTFREFSIQSGMKNQVNERYEAIIHESEKGGFAFNVGLDVRYSIGNDIYLGTGLGFIQTKITGNYNFEIYGLPIVNTMNEIEALTSQAKPYYINAGIIQTYRYLQVPLHVSYQPWVSKKVRMIVEGGFSYVRFLGADGTTIDYQSLAPKDLSKETFNKNLAALDFKVGATYYFSKSVALGLEPTLMYFSGSIYPDDHPVQVVPWSIGLNFNIRMRLL